LVERLGNFPATMTHVGYGSAAAGIQIPISAVVF
jgi:hypothetical protein